jgi:predicted DsbA family dithiol-disulfide isomerase
MAMGVQSTPTFFINGRMIAGAAPYELFAKVIDEELERAKGRRVAANAEGRTR